MKGMVERVNDLFRVAAASHSRSVQAVAACVISDRERKRQRIFNYDRVAANVSLAAHAAELMHAGVSAHVRAVFDLHVARERCAVRHDNAIPQVAVMRDVRLRHDQAVVTYLSEHTAAFCAAMYGDKLAYAVAATHARLRGLALVLQILRCQAYRNEGKDVRVVAYHGSPINDAVRVEPHAFAQSYFVADDAVRAYGAIRPDFRAVAYDRCWMNTLH